MVIPRIYVRHSWRWVEKSFACHVCIPQTQQKPPLFVEDMISKGYL